MRAFFKRLMRTSHLEQDFLVEIPAFVTMCVTARDRQNAALIPRHDLFEQTISWVIAGHVGLLSPILVAPECRNLHGNSKVTQRALGLIAKLGKASQKVSLGRLYLH